mmetsp:Transcript_26977/g.45998  ORF Transcript_26977/g.45998 Transcript_26977/m.45998 type:complete len:397 (-) Transcript_26977:185-1375(-)|eukprot:CAMPEP_0183703892 /NCGR_PEP_ID=MMETSP0737-20130205/1446_1 /TAXON_ID=385413 /ORGANISM="Thalassiosira miniscula, Strain CCMP1093" /LENGTH=396 /DNA_ID=CAMNT_0025930693 /DNA_START=50 /DNA_END=1240 /DNA_ORIENTATION=+
MSSNNEDSQPPIYRVSRSDPPRLPIGGSWDHRDISDNRRSAHPRDVCIDPSKTSLLPTTADVIYGDRLEKFQWSGTLETIFAGTRDENSPLSALREHEGTIVRDAFSFIGSQWAAHVKQTVPAYLVGRSDFGGRMQFNHGRIGNKNWSRRNIDVNAETTSSGFEDGFVAYARVGEVEFPKPSNRNVNMMPFIFGDKDSLPDDLQCYFPLIEKCPYMKDDIGKVGYLTVHESYVDIGEAQRREGLHIESPGVFSDVDAKSTAFTPGVEHRWGMGVFWGPDRYDGGIYMASSVKGTSKIWDALVDSTVPGIVDRHGGCEHLRGLIGEGTALDAGELVWFTDMTPHEALPQKESGFRQFFRVVTPSVTHWFADHSTANPKAPLPSNVNIVRGNKFESKD